MNEKLIYIAHMLSHGLDSIDLYHKRDYKKNIPASARDAALERWYDIGERLGQAADKVVKQGG